MPTTKCSFCVLILIFLIIIIICNANTTLKDHIVTKQHDVTIKFSNIKKKDRYYHEEVENLEVRKTYSDNYQNLIFYDDKQEFITSSWNIYTKTRGTKVYIVNNNRNSNVCNYMKRKYDIPLILEFAEKGLISFQYKSYLDIDKMNSFVTYISHLHSKYSLSIAYISSKREYIEIPMDPQSNITYNYYTNWRKIKYTIESPQYKHFYKYLLIRNNGPHNIIYIGQSMFLPKDIMFYSDEEGVNTDYMYLTGTNLININRNGYYSITSLTSYLMFSLVFNNNSDKSITNLNYFDGLSFFIINTSATAFDIEFSINTSIGEFSSIYSIALHKSVISVMFDFRNIQGFDFMLADTKSISFSFQSDDPNCIFRIREITGHIKYPTERRFDIVFNRYKNKTVDPVYFEIRDNQKYIDNQCLIFSGKNLINDERNLPQSIAVASLCCIFILLINIIFLFKYKVFHSESKEKISKY
jgi:hypothetical protein